MTTLDRPHTALSVLDAQNDVVANAYRLDAVIANVRDLIDTAREPRPWSRPPTSTSD